jgi:hypothetical protein
MYYDSDLGFTRIAERRLLGPVNNGLVGLVGSGILNPHCIPNATFTACTGTSVGYPVFLIGGAGGALPTRLKGQEVFDLIPGIVAQALANIGTPPTSGSLDGVPRNIELLKQGGTLFFRLQPGFSASS